MTPFDGTSRTLDNEHIAVVGRGYVGLPVALALAFRADGVVIDVKAALDPTALPPALQYWSL